LRRVWEGLNSQTYKHVEWIVANDGSSDGTENIVRKLAAQSEFSVTLINASVRVGKARMDNEAVRQARGQFILWCDSDDWLLPNALQRFWETWNSIPANLRDDFVGMTALAATEQGCIVSPFPNIDLKDVSWNDLAAIHRVEGDMLLCTRADLLKAHPFPVVDFYVPESILWTTIGNRPARLIPQVLLMKEYRAAHAISFTDTINYNRGRAYSLATTVRNLGLYRRSWNVHFWHLITFIRYSLHGEIALGQALRLWDNNSPWPAFWLATPLAFALALKDQLQGKVRKTHQVCLANQNTARLTVEVLNSGSRQ
jgi:glycosyltransferase involved in cell wall biosynthesis